VRSDPVPKVYVGIAFDLQPVDRQVLFAVDLNAEVSLRLSFQRVMIESRMVRLLAPDSERPNGGRLDGIGEAIPAFPEASDPMIDLLP